MPNRSPRDLSGRDLVAKFRILVSHSINLNRDSMQFENLKKQINSVQILLGMYRCREFNLTVSQFIKIIDDWLEEDEDWAEIELSCYLDHFPDEYYIYKDLQHEETAFGYQTSMQARNKLKSWADRVLA